MIRLLLVLALALAGIPSAAVAQPVTVRAGDHDGFTRLVLRLPRPANWRFGRTDGGYELRIEAPDLRFDLSRVFDVIGRQRIEAVWADPASGNLVLGVPCACHAVAYASTPTLIVIDVRRGTGDPASGFERRLDGQEAAPLQDRGSSARLRPRRRPGSAADPGAVMPPIAYDWRRPAAGAPQGRAMPLAASAAAVRLRAALETELARAAVQGLVDPLPGPRLPRTDKVPSPGGANEPNDAAPQAETGATSGAENMRLLADSDAASGVLTSDGRACVPDTALAFLRDAPETTQALMPAGWAGLLDASDRPDPGAAITLARRYLALGFGAEARAILRSFDVPGPEAAVLGTIAGILEEDGRGDARALEGMEVCDGDVALWALLAGPARRGGPMATEAVVRAFSGLPLHLRRVVGPAVAERFVARGDPGSARAIRDAIARPDNAHPTVQLLDAELAAAAGAPEAADARFRALAEAPGEGAIRALARLAERIVDRGGTVDAETMIALAAAMQEQGGGPDGLLIGRAYARALAAGGDFGAAFAVAAASDPGVEAEVWALLAERADAGALLRFAAEPPADPSLPPETRIAIAERHVALGMPELALAWTGGAGGARARLAAAAAALLQRDGRAALRELAGIDAPESAALRAAALELLGQFPEAAEAWITAGEPSRAASAAWESRDWARVAALAADPDRSAAIGALAAASETAPGDGAPTLAGARNLLARAGAQRSAIEGLLARTPRAAPEEPAGGP